MREVKGGAASVHAVDLLILAVVCALHVCVPVSVRAQCSRQSFLHTTSGLSCTEALGVKPGLAGPNPVFAPIMSVG